MEYQRILNYIDFPRVTPDGSSRSIFRRLCSRSFMVVEMSSGSYRIHQFLNPKFFIFVAASLSSIGCALSAPDGSSPRGYGWISVVNHRLKLTFSIPSSSSCCKPPSPRRGFPYFLWYILFYYRLLCAEFNSVKKIMGLILAKAREYVLINKAHLARVKNPKQIPPPPHHLLLHLGFLSSNLSPWLMQMGPT
jgi:hypothetical protein